MYVGRMKLTRNKIRKIRKQQHQSVRKWKRARKSPRRKATTFRRSRSQQVVDMMDNSSPSPGYPLKLNNVFNKTLKRYIPLPVLSYMKDKYDKMKRMRRKQRREKMIGGGSLFEQLFSAASVAASAAASAAVGSNLVGARRAAGPGATPGAGAGATPGATGPGVAGATAAGAAGPGATAGADNNTPDSTSVGAGEKNTGFNLGPAIEGDIPISSVSFVLERTDDAQKLLTFLVNKCLPYYIQLELKPGKQFNKHDTDIFDLRRILCGKFATKKDFETDGKIPDKKRDLYFKAPDQIGIADGDTIGNEYPNDVFIYTGEKGTIDRSSTDKTIKVSITGNENNQVSVLDSNRLYKLTGDGPKSIDDFETVLAYGTKVVPSEFRLQVAPMSKDEFKKAAATSSSDGDKKKGKKVVTDDSNSYVVNLSVGCKVTSIQTLRKSLESMRVSLEDEDDDSKTAAMDILKMLTSLLQNPEFAKNEGFDDFKNKVFEFSYKIPGLERKYSLTQMMTFFNEKKNSLSPDLTKEFFKLLSLLGHGPAGENGACLAFDPPKLPLMFETIVDATTDGKVKEVTRLTNKGNITSIEGIFKDMEGDADKEKGDDETAATKKDEGATTKDGEGAVAVEGEGAGAAAEGEGAVAEGEGAGATAEGEGTGATAEGEGTDAGATNIAPSAGTSAKTNKNPVTKDDIKEIDAVNSRGDRWKAYLVKQFIFRDLQDMNLVHFMGWGKQSDEFIPEPEARSRILPRDEKTSTGQGITDKTIDDVLKLYKDVDMAKLESQAIAESEEYNKKQEEVSATSAIAMESRAAAAAAAAAAASAAATVAMAKGKRK